MEGSAGSSCLGTSSGGLVGLAVVADAASVGLASCCC